MFHPFGRLLATSRRRHTRSSPEPRTHLFLEPLEGRVVPATYTVINLGDAGAGNNNQGDLRYCIQQVDDHPLDITNEIYFANGLQGTITLNSELPSIANNVGIDGPGSNLITVARSSTAAAFRIFTVGSTFEVGIQGLTISGGLLTSGNGAGVYNKGNLTLYADDITNNQVTSDTGYGGGIYNASGGTLAVESSSIDYNQAEWGGGIANFGGSANSGSATILATQIFGNKAAVGTTGEGGGIYNGSTGTMTVTFSSSITNNSAEENGGGVYNIGSFTMHGGNIGGNDTVNYNGGGLYNDDGGNVTLDQGITIASNSGNDGGGLYLHSGSITTLNTVTIQNHTIQITGHGKGIYQQNGANLTETNVTDPDDPNGPYKGP